MQDGLNISESYHYIFDRTTIFAQGEPKVFEIIFFFQDFIIEHDVDCCLLAVADDHYFADGL